MAAIPILLATLCLRGTESAGASQQQPAGETPTTEQILARMMEVDRATEAQLREYTSIRRYYLENKRFGKQAEMTVRMRFQHPGRKQFEVLSERGSATIRKLVFRRMQEAERDASREGLREATQITPRNYTFRLLGTEDLDGRKSFILEVSPKTKNVYLFQGKVWVDAEDYQVARIEGSPAQKPSFWIRRTSFVHRYGKFGPFWLAVSNHSETEAWLFGRTEVRIEYRDYRINPESLDGTEITGR